MKVKVIGAGLAGCEAVWQLVKHGIDVDLYEMKPVKYSPAHSNENFAELVCSNSLKADRIENACGLLKEEMRMFDSVMMEAADISRVPAGGALAVDRDVFAKHITEKIKNHPRVTVFNEEVTEINPDEYTIIATGPLTSDGLADEIKEITGSDELYFYDAAAPIVTEESIDKGKVFKAARYDKGTADYINCPMNKEEYETFYNALISAERAPLHDCDVSNPKVYEGCMPVEVMAKRGIDTLRYGPLKPVGFDDPRTGRRPYALVQLRQDNAAKSLYNLVGFQTHLKYQSQKELLKLIPGLEKAEIVRYGMMHRNTYINSRKLLNNGYQLLKNKNIFFAGQITGVEGYVESASSGLIAGINMARYLENKPLLQLDSTTAIGSLANYISFNHLIDRSNHFDPMNANFGIFTPLLEKVSKKERKKAYAQRAIKNIKKLIEEINN